MSRLDVQFLDEGLHRVLFDAMPLPVFVVDKDINILEYNAAAARLLGKAGKPGRQRRGGDVLHCLHATESPEGCGCAPACSIAGCASRCERAFRGRRDAPMGRDGIDPQGKPAKVNLRVSCQPFTYGRSTFILLVLEGLND